jgi:hypothetical protein
MSYTPVSSQDIDLEDQLPKNGNSLLHEPPAYQPATPSTKCTQCANCADCAPRVDHTEEYLLDIARTHKFSTADVKLLAAHKDYQSSEEEEEAKRRKERKDKIEFRCVIIFGVLTVALMVYANITDPPHKTKGGE